MIDCVIGAFMATDTEAQGATEIPAGSWTVDPIHSVAGFAVRHMMVGTFRGEFSEIDATLTDGKLVGKVKVASLQIKDEKLKGHLFSPDFFDVERYPEIVYESSSLTVNDGALTSEGTLTVKGKTTPATATGRFAGPTVTLGGVEWNAPLPKGGFVLGKDVTISVTLELALVDDED